MFTNNWFEVTAKANFEKYVKGLTGRFLEIGCYEGRATVWMLENTTALVEVIDTFEGSTEHTKEESDGLYQRFMDNVKGYEKKLTVHTGKSADVLKTFKGQFDFIYIDGSHTAPDVLTDGVLALTLLQKGGIIIFDDYTWGGGSTFSILDRPQAGIDAFMRIYADSIQTLAVNSQVVLTKLMV